LQTNNQKQTNDQLYLSMKTSKQKSRRQFLRNTALAGLTVSLFPNIANAARGTASEACNATTQDYYGQGPFYTAGPPTITNNMLASVNEPGTRLILSGVVRTLDCSQYIADTVIDVWHANDAGAYDNVDYNLRGVTQANSQGFYLFETIMPGKYLNGPSYRPSHIHFLITPPGFSTLTTQLYFEGDSDIPGDAAARLTSGQYDATDRIIPVTMNNDGKYEGTWDIIVDGTGVTGIQDLHVNHGIIYSASPNPFSNELNIYYGVFQPAKVNISIFDLNGSLVAVLDEKQLAPQKYYATWRPESNLAKGIYIVTLKINDLQVHYQKVMKI